MPSQNTIVQQLVVNYLPTALGTFIEPFWVVLNRLLCILQPFDELRRRHAPTSRTLLLRYTSLPPQLAIWRALRAGDLLLAMVCSVAILANVLTVALSGLFVVQTTEQARSFMLEQNISPFLQPGKSSGNGDFAPSGLGGAPLQVVLSNLSANTALPSWTTPEYFFLPAELPESSNISDYSQYEFESTGLGAQLDCQSMQESGSNFTYEFKLNSDATEANFSIAHTQPDGSIVRCYSPNGNADDNDGNSEATQVWLHGPPNGKKALEFFIQPIPSQMAPTPASKSICPNLLVGGWIRSTISMDSKTSETVNGLTANTSSVSIEKTFMVCQPRFQTGLFNVTVDSAGFILKAAKSGPLNDTMDTFTIQSMWNATTFLIGRPTDYLEWHKDSFASDWVNLFIKEFTNTTAITDPLAPPPDFAVTSRAVNAVYQRLFAATLQLNSGSLQAPPKSSLIPATELTTEPRIFMSTVMYGITLSILTLDLLIAIILYIRLPKPFLENMPTSIASILAYFAASHALKDMGPEENETSRDFIRRTEQSDHQYGFGQYIGTDGRSHLGIEREPYVFPLKDGISKRKWWKRKTSSRR